MRLVDAVSGTSAVALGVLIVALFSASTGADPEPAPRPPTAAVPDHVQNAEHCAKGADTLVQVADAITDAGGVADPVVVDELRSAEERLVRREAVPSERLTATFGDLESSLAELRRAVDDGADPDPALDSILRLVDVLDEQCQVVTRPAD